MGRTIVVGSDFSYRDGSVWGGLWGTAIKINPEARLMNLSHEVESISEAAFLLLSGYLDYPEESVFLFVVDPGVGTDRKMIAAKCGSRIFIAPDNGLLWPILEFLKPEKVISLDGEEVRKIAGTLVFVIDKRRDERLLRPASRVFHGRDYFMPAAALISRGTPLEELGEEIELKQLVKLSFKLKRRKKCLIGEIVVVDTWGNLITTITKGDFDDFVKGYQGWEIWVGDRRDKAISEMVETFAEAKEGELTAHTGGSFLHPDPKKDCFLSIFIDGDSASELLEGVKIGEKVTVARR